jgi:aspartate racemase
MGEFLGVLGGMGPLATADFLHKLVAKSQAQSDQEHIPILLYGDCTTPDRTANLIGAGDSPLPKLIEGIKFLNKGPIKAISIPCNTSHHWVSEMQASSDVPIIDIINASVAQINSQTPNAKKVGVLSTLGTQRMGLYRETLQEAGYEAVEPSELEFETLVSPAIAMTKAHRLQEAEILFHQASVNLVERGADIIILGCTEIPIGMAQQLLANPSQFIDSTAALVEATLDHFVRPRRGHSH